MEYAASIFRLEVPSDGRNIFLHSFGKFPLPHFVLFYVIEIWQ
jgi:hypothetical protein